MAAPKYLERELTTGQVAEVIATETGPASEVIVSTTSAGTIDPSLLPVISTSGHFVQATVDFGTDGSTATTTVTGQTWVTSGSVILCNPFGGTTSDHGPEDALVEGLVAYASNLVPGVGFDVQVYAPQNTFGQYLVNATGQ